MDEKAHLAAIAAAPDEDAPRLRYADWLIAAGRRQRGELIRLQLERALTGSQYCTRAELALAQDPAALGPLPAWAGTPTVWDFSRGFLDRIKLASLAAVYARVPDLRALVPQPRRIEAGERAVRLSPDGRRLAHRDGSSEITESGRVTYASGVSQVTVYRVIDRAKLWTGKYPYRWNDGDRPDGTEQLDDFWFAPDSASLVLRFVSAPGVKPATRREQREVLP